MSEATEGQQVAKDVGDFSNLAADENELDKDADTLGMRGVWMETLFVLVSGNNISHILEWILLFTEDLQIIYGVFPRDTDSTAHTFPLPIWMGFIFNPLAPRTYATYLEYIQFFAVTFIAILIWGANGAYVAYTVYCGTYVVSPLQTFRLMSAFFPSVLFIPMVEMMLSAILECTYKTDAHLTVVSEETIGCLSGIHLLIYVLAIACLLFFIPVSIFLVINFVSTDPTYKTVSSRVHGRCDAMFAVLKVFLLVITRVFADSFPSAEISVMFVSAAMLCLIDRYRPHYNALVNNCRCANFSSVLVFAITVVVLRVVHASDQNVAAAIVLTVACVTWVMAFFLSAFRYRRRCSRVLERLKEVETLTGFVKRNYLVFDNWPSVEIACRFITDGMNDRRRSFDESKVPLIHAIFTRGIEEFPKVPLVHLSYNLYSNFCRSNSSKWFYPLSVTKRLKPAFDTAFFVYMTEGLESRQAQMTLLGSNVSLEVTEFAEYKKLEKAAMSNHEKARQKIRIFWHVICKENPQPDTVSNIVSDVRLAVNQADKSYRRLLHMYPASVPINRSYGAFLIEIKHEPETADNYIQRAEDLDRKAMARKNGMEFLSDHTPNSGTIEAENAQLPHTDMPSTESFELDEQTMKRSSSRGSEGSRLSSTSNAAGRRVTALQNLSVAADLRIKRFTVGSTVVFLAGVGVIIGAHVFIQRYLTQVDNLQAYGRVLRRRLYFSSEIFLLLRKMVLAANSSDEEEFDFLKNRLIIATRNYRSFASSAYTDTPPDMLALRASFITSDVGHILKAHPSNVTIVVNTTLYEFSEIYGNKAALLLDASYSTFAQGNMAANDDFRYIFDNYGQLQTAFIGNIVRFKADKSAGLSDAYVTWMFSLVVCVILGGGAVFIIERWFRDMHQHHLTRLDLFKKIPKNIRTAIRDNLDSSVDESIEPDQLPYLSSRAQLFNPVRKFRLRGCILVLFICILACLFAADGNMALSDLNKLSGVITPLGELRLGAISIALTVTEMMVQDVPTTWSNSSVIYKVFQGGLDYYTTMLNAVIYPSLDSGGLADFPPAMYALWAQPSCLAENVTVCENPTYNYDVGFTPAAVQNGLGLLVEEYRISASAIAAIATNGVLDANDPSGLFIIAADRDFLAGGLVKLTDFGTDTLRQAIIDNRIILFLILSIQLIIATLGYIFVFHAMSRWYRNRDDATNLLLMILPASAMKSDGELEKIVRTGIIVDKADASARSLLQTKVFKTPSAIGSLFISRRGSRVTTNGDSPKDDKSLVQVEAKLKKLQFEQTIAENDSLSSENWLAPSMARRISDAQAHPPLRSNPSLILSSVLADGE